MNMVEKWPAMSDTPSPNPRPSSSASSAAGKAVLTEAIPADIIHTSLAGMTGIVLMLLGAVALPVFHYAPVSQLFAFIIMAATSLTGIGGLYYMNYKVHQHVTRQARLTEVLVNSLGQGFLTFNSEGICGPVYSQACLDLLESVPAGKNVQEVLHVPESQRADFKDWMNILFMPNHALGFDDIIKFMPPFFPHSQGRRISLVYKPIRTKDESLYQVVVIATDQTEEYEAQQRAKQQQNFADMICRIFRERNQFRATLTHIREFLEISNHPVRREEAAPMLRSLHTLKAAVKHFNLTQLGDIVHKLELDLRSETVTSDEQFQAILKDGRQKIAEAVALVKEEVRDLIGQDYEWRGNMHEVEEKAIYDFAAEMQQQRADPDLIRRYLNTIAAVPVNDCFRAFESELRDLAQITGKQVKQIRFTGSNPRVLTQSIQNFLFSLTHICRNIVDHGIEPPITRMARGKDPAGQVSIHTEILNDEQKGTLLHIVISDDGHGIDPSRVRDKLSLIDPQGSWRQEDDQTLIQRIFGFGFSTSENVTDLSGQGVGMEAVEREVKQLGGSIKVYSELYKGVRFDIHIPYRLDLGIPAKSPPAAAAR